MQIKFKHILLFIIICFLIYLDYNWYISTDFTLDKSRQVSRNAGIFISIHTILGLLLITFITLFTNLEYHIIKLLNKNIFKL